MKYDISRLEDHIDVCKTIAKEYSRTPFALLLLQGTLGAGKTTFAKCFLEQMGVKEVIQSPTYTVMRSYEGAGIPLYHIDLYRLSSVEEVMEYGILDLIAREQGIFLIEWPALIREELVGVAPCSTLEFTIEGEERTLTRTMS